MVGFEKTVYSVPEDIPGGVMELCAIVYTSDSVDCPILFPFTVQANIPSRGVLLMMKLRYSIFNVSFQVIMIL